MLTQFAIAPSSYAHTIARVGGGKEAVMKGMAERKRGGEVGTAVNKRRMRWGAR